MFQQVDAAEVRDALEEIASPLDSYGWSSDAVYTFWCPATRNLLYVGLAVDIAQRFAQHLSIGSRRTRGCKAAELQGWFATHREVGYSVIFQSSFMQPPVGRHRRSPGRLADEPLPGELRLLEGRFIEAHRRRFGRVPPWNAIGGSRSGQLQMANVGPDNLFELLTGQKDSLLVARPSIRELAASATAVFYEDCMHTARLRAAMSVSLGGDIRSEAILGELIDLTAQDETARRLVNDRWISRRSAFLREHGSDEDKGQTDDE